MISFPANAILPGVTGGGPGGGRFLAMIQEVPGLAPLPASPPIEGFAWTVVVPAILFLGSFLGTYLLYKRFSKEEGE